MDGAAGIVLPTGPYAVVRVALTLQFDDWNPRGLRSTEVELVLATVNGHFVFQQVSCVAVSVGRVLTQSGEGGLEGRVGFEDAVFEMGEGGATLLQGSSRDHLERVLLQRHVAIAPPQRVPEDEVPGR